MSRGIGILITGGYGTVGRRVAAYLAPGYPDRVVVAGRSDERAARLAAELGHGVRARRVDVGDPDSVEVALEGVGLVVIGPSRTSCARRSGVGWPTRTSRPTS